MKFPGREKLAPGTFNKDVRTYLALRMYLYRWGVEISSFNQLDQLPGAITL
jgi:hypothetical protein